MSIVESTGSRLPVAVDAMGGDHGPHVIVEGALQAVRQTGIDVVVVGNKVELEDSLRRLGAEETAKIRIEHAPDVVTMDDSPSKVLRGKTSSSIRVAFELVHAGRASAVVSAGNTGAVMAAGIFISGTIPGITRPAIATLIPKVGEKVPTVLLDSGANTDCHAQQLVQFAVMGNYYAISVLTCEKPRVALLSNGSEASKGTDTLRAAAMSLGVMENINFVGYVEGRDLGHDVADVVVCDGFVGNVVLKAMEGTVDLVLDSIRYGVRKSLIGRAGMWLARPAIRRMFHDKLDPAAYGGAPLLGLNGAAIICHGSSGARAIMNAVRVAQRYVDGQVSEKIGAAVSEIASGVSTGYDEGPWKRAGNRTESRATREIKG